MLKRIGVFVLGLHLENYTEHFTFTYLLTFKVAMYKIIVDDHVQLLSYKPTRFFNVPQNSAKLLSFVNLIWYVVWPTFNTLSYNKAPFVQDPAIRDAKVIIDLMDAIRPKSINYENVREGGNEEVIFVTVSLLHILFIKSKY